MRVEALHAAARAADAAASARVPPGRRGARRGAPRRRRGRRRARRGRRRARAVARRLRTRGVATCRTRSWSTSHSMVGIGVPSSSQGAFSITAGVPSGRRTTTRKRPAGARPSWRVTAARSSARGVERLGQCQNSSVATTLETNPGADVGRARATSPWRSTSRSHPGSTRRPRRCRSGPRAGRARGRPGTARPWTSTSA